MRIASLPFFVSAALIFAFVATRRLSSQELLDVSARFQVPPRNAKGETRNATDRPPAVIWLTPLDSSHTPAPDRNRQYTLLQKNKEFSPHVLVVPVGSVVQFPNADPFFHNVFSLFDGRRFDLGLYEAGSTRGVTFGKEGISYIFCNIHPEMSAVVLALSTPFYAVEDKQGAFRIPDVPADEYLLQVWVQGADPAELKTLSRKVRIAAGQADLGVIRLSQAPHPPSSHTNKYGKAYDAREPSVY